jgi:hypothetical protein
MAEITVNGVTLDPVHDSHTLTSLGLASADVASSNFIVLQTRGPVSRQQEDQLAQAGVKLLEHLPQDARICEYKEQDLDRLRTLPFVAWVNVYAKEFKVAPELNAAAQPSSAQLLSLHGPEMTRT